MLSEFAKIRQRSFWKITRSRAFGW
jgi:hypothetical protein